MEKRTFRGRVYTYERTYQTTLTLDYVPEWNIFHAMRESFQNAFDEAVVTGEDAGMYMNGIEDEAWIYDNGRGVDFEDILYLGATDKRGRTDLVGEHGEGEVLSFLVAAREGYEKVMASRDWMAVAEFQKDETGRFDILVIHRYKAQTPRKQGTLWFYGGWNAYEEAKAARAEFVATTDSGRKSFRTIQTEDAGQLYTKGMKVNTISGLALGYNLPITPGRDRAGFTLGQVEGEIKKALEETANVDDVYQILKAKHHYGSPHELKLDVMIGPAIVKAAGNKLARDYSNKNKIVWADAGESSWTADAREQGYIVLGFYSKPPYWIREGLAHVSEVVNGSTEGKNVTALPQSLAGAVDPLMELLGSNMSVECVIEFNDGANALQGLNHVILSRRAVKGMDTQTLLGVLAHEVAHYETGAEDCTRAHERGIRKLLTQVAENLVNGEAARELYVKADKALRIYNRR